MKLKISVNFHFNYNFLKCTARREGLNLSQASNLDGFVHEIYDGSQMPVTTGRFEM